SLHPENSSNYLQLVHSFPRGQLTGSPRCFVFDKKGLIWIGTREHGLIGYKQEADQLKKKYQFNVGTGLMDNFVTSLACDSFNNLIVGTQTGLDRILFNADSTYRIENLSKSSNFFALIDQTWADKNQAYALTSSGVLLQLSSAPVTKTNKSPQLLLEEIRVN